MVSISEKNLHAEFFQNVLGDAFNRTQRSHWHKDRGLYLAVRSDEVPGTGTACGSLNLKGQRHESGL
jgi:hypothetical protein